MEQGERRARDQARANERRREAEAQLTPAQIARIDAAAARATQPR